MFSKQLQPKWVAEDIIQMLRLTGLLSKTDTEQAPKVFMGYGQSDKWAAVKKMFTEAFGFEVEVSFNYGPNQRPIANQLHHQLQACSAAVFAITKDQLFKVDTPNGPSTLVNQNIIYEMGMAQPQSSSCP